MFVITFDALAQATDFRIERRQVAFHCWDQDLNPGVRDPHFPADWIPTTQTDWAIKDQGKNLKSMAHPHDEKSFSALDTTASWLSHLALAIYISLLLTLMPWDRQATILIEMIQVAFLC